MWNLPILFVARILVYRNPVDDWVKAQNVPKNIATFKGYDFAKWYGDIRGRLQSNSPVTRSAMSFPTWPVAGEPHLITR
jgi:hypothetical protein